MKGKISYIPEDYVLTYYKVISTYSIKFQLKDEFKEFHSLRLKYRRLAQHNGITDSYFPNVLFDGLKVLEDNNIKFKIVEGYKNA